MVEDWVLEDLLNVFIADFGWLFTRRSQMLPTIHCKINLCITEVFWFVIGQEENGAVADTSSYLSAISTLLLAANHFFVEIDTGSHFFSRLLLCF